MARAFLSHDPFPIEDQLRILENEDLLDFWEESQFLDRYLEADKEHTLPSAVYENAILHELRLRYSLGQI